MSGLIEQLVTASPNRRKFLKTIGVATAGVAAMSMAKPREADAATPVEVEIGQFALNLEYLEAEFYTWAVYNRSMENLGIGVSGQANGSNPTAGGPTMGAVAVNFNSNQSDAEELAIQIGSDERAHVTLLRQALEGNAVAKPPLNLNALGLSTGTLFDFLRQARAFEDIGVSAYAGAASNLTTPGLITLAARILGAEAEHVASLRTLMAQLQVSDTKLDNADIVPPPTGLQILSTYSGNGLVVTRTPGEVLYLAFGGQANAIKGGFFPSGVNGKIAVSSSAAPGSNLGPDPNA